MRPRIHALTAALGLFASFGAMADKGGLGGGPLSDASSHGRGGSRFLESGSAGPASAFDQHANLVKGGGLEFQATSKAALSGHDGGHGPSMPSSSSGPGGNDNGASPGSTPSGDAALLAQGAVSGSKGKVTVAESGAVVLFAPWKVTDKDGKPVEKKAGHDCGTK